MGGVSVRLRTSLGGPCKRDLPQQQPPRRVNDEWGALNARALFLRAAMPTETVRVLRALQSCARACRVCARVSVQCAVCVLHKCTVLISSKERGGKENCRR